MGDKGAVKVEKGEVEGAKGVAETISEAEGVASKAMLGEKKEEGVGGKAEGVGWEVKEGSNVTVVSGETVGVD